MMPAAALSLLLFNVSGGRTFAHPVTFPPLCGASCDERGASHVLMYLHVCVDAFIVCVSGTYHARCVCEGFEQPWNMWSGLRG